MLRTWRGTPYADLTDHPDVLAERTGLEALRTTASDDLALGLLALGEHATVLALTEQATARDPLRERGWALHVLALARAGRQAEALDAIRRLRRLLDDEARPRPRPGGARPRGRPPPAGARGPARVVAPRAPRATCQQSPGGGTQGPGPR